MNITLKHFDRATAQGVLNPGQGLALWHFLQAEERDSPRFKPAHILYYLGGMVAIGAMTLFMTLGWERLGGAALFGIASAYIAAAVLGTEYLLHRKRLVLPAGITAALAVALVPLATYGAQRWLGWWPDQVPGRGYRDYHAVIDWRWLMMELASLAAAAVALWRWRLTFIVMPLAVTLWYLSMDIVPVLLGGDAWQFFSDTGKRVSTGFGLCMVLLAVQVDLRSRQKDYAFWLYVFGVLSFWGGLTSMESNSEPGKFIYACINLVLIGVGTALSRRVFVVFGGFGVALYLGHLSYTVFRDSLLFPVALAATGLGVMLAGVAWQRHEATLGARLRGMLPTQLQELVERRS